MDNNWGSQMFNDLRNRNIKTQNNSWLSMIDLQIRNMHIPVEFCPYLLEMLNRKAKHEKVR